MLLNVSTGIYVCKEKDHMASNCPQTVSWRKEKETSEVLMVSPPTAVKQDMGKWTAETCRKLSKETSQL